MLLAVAVLQIVGVVFTGLLARGITLREPRRMKSAEHLIDQLSQAAKLYELDGPTIYPPGESSKSYCLQPRTECDCQRHVRFFQIEVESCEIERGDFTVDDIYADFDSHP